MAYLDDHPPARSQFRCPRRERESGVIVVHTAENTPDYVAFDGGAEAVARFIQSRSDPGSYHALADSDSIVNLVRRECEAFHDGTGSNPHSFGVSAATRHDVWPLAPQAWRDGCIWHMAAAVAGYAADLEARTGIRVPARRITRSESELRIPGFISHAERDPTRRRDPGATFPWDQFLGTYSYIRAGSPPAGSNRSESTVDITVGPDGNVHEVVVGDDAAVYHLYAPTAEGLATAAIERLGGRARAVTATWHGERYVVVCHGFPEDVSGTTRERAYTKEWTGTEWTDWSVQPYVNLQRLG